MKEKLKTVLFMFAIWIKAFYGIIKKFFHILFKYTIKLILCIACSIVILLPAIFSGMMSFFPNFDYEKYVYTLEIIVNSAWIYVIGGILVLIIFKEEICRKLEKLKKAKDFEFFDKQSENIDSSHKNSSVTMDEEEKENVENKIKANFNNKSTDDKVILENIMLKKENLSLNRQNKHLKMMFIQRGMANDTKMLLNLMYFKKMTNISKEQIFEFFNKMNNKSFGKVRNVFIEVNSIIKYLTNAGIIESEDDENFDITSFGRQYLEFIFEGRMPE